MMRQEMSCLKICMFYSYNTFSQEENGKKRALKSNAVDGIRVVGN